MSAWAQGAVWTAGAILTLDALIRLLGGLWRRTAGRWRHARSQLQRLAANADIGYFDQVLGAPFLKRRLVRLSGSRRLLVDDRPAGGISEFIYVGVGFYLQAVTDGNNRVIAYTVTTKDTRLKAQVPVPNLGIFTRGARPVDLVLGSSYFAEVPWTPGRIFTDVLAHNVGYRESYYLGTPGNYQTLVLSYNDAGIAVDSVIDRDALFSLARSLDDNATEIREGRLLTRQAEDRWSGIVADFIDSTSGRLMRQKLEINSYTVTAPHIEGDLALPIFGVDINDVLVLRRVSYKQLKKFWRKGKEPKGF